MIKFQTSKLFLDEASPSIMRQLISKPSSFTSLYTSNIPSPSIAFDDPYLIQSLCRGAEQWRRDAGNSGPTNIYTSYLEWLLSVHCFMPDMLIGNHFSRSRRICCRERSQNYRRKRTLTPIEPGAITRDHKLQRHKIGFI